MSMTERTQGPAPSGSSLEAPPRINFWEALVSWLDRSAGSVLVLPAVLVILFLSVFPLVVSLYISVIRLQFAAGGFKLRFVGLQNYAKLFTGADHAHLLGALAPPSPLGWLIFGLLLIGLILGFTRYLRRGKITGQGLIGRSLGAIVAIGLFWLIIHTLGTIGRPGTLVTTLIYVFVGVTIQYLLGLSLAYLCAQQISGRRFFRVLFLLPMMITPVGVAYLFRMLTDTSKGPLYPVWYALGLSDTSWVTNPWGARAAV